MNLLLPVILFLIAVVLFLILRQIGGIIRVLEYLDRNSLEENPHPPEDL